MIIVYINYNMMYYKLIYFIIVYLFKLFYHPIIIQIIFFLFYFKKCKKRLLFLIDNPYNPYYNLIN